LNYGLKKKETNSVALVREQERQPLVAKASANFLRIEGCCVIITTDPYGCILGFLDRSLYFFFQIDPQL
jgi:hypothetical protein